MKSKIQNVLLLVVLCVLAACSSDDNGIDNPNKQGDKNLVKINIAMEAVFEAKQDKQATRSLEKLEFLNGRLVPKFTNNQADVLMIFGNTSQVAKVKKVWNYDSTTGVLAYRGDVEVPAAMLTNTSGLKLMLMVYPKDSYNESSGVITMNHQFAYQNNNADQNEFPFAVPYFSNWVDISGKASTAHIEVKREDMKLYPQGMIMKVIASDEQSYLNNVKLLGLRFESNVMSEQGTYKVPSNPSEVGQSIQYTPTDEGGANAIKVYDEKLATPLDFKTTRQVFYKWVEARPSVTAPYTRSYLILQYTEPVLSHTFASDAWWDGTSNVDSKIIVANRNTNDLSANGSTNTLKLTNLNVLTHINRFAYSVTSESADGSQTIFSDNVSPSLLPWKDRLLTNYSLYTKKWLVDQNYMGPAPTAIRPANGEPNSKNVDWRIPSTEDFRLLYPTDATVVGVFKLLSSNYSSDGSAMKYTNKPERVRFRNHKAAVQDVLSSYALYDAGHYYSNERAVLALRFSGGDNLNKTIYQYRTPNKESGNAAMQVQAYYVGPYFPELTDAPSVKKLFEDFGNATFIRPWNHNKKIIDWAPDERIFVTYRGYWGQNFYGNSYWINANDKPRAFKYNIQEGTFEETAPDDDNTKHTLLLIRDF